MKSTAGCKHSVKLRSVGKIALFPLPDYIAKNQLTWEGAHSVAAIITHALMLPLHSAIYVRTCWLWEKMDQLASDMQVNHKSFVGDLRMQTPWP